MVLFTRCVDYGVGHVSGVERVAYPGIREGHGEILVTTRCPIP